MKLKSGAEFFIFKGNEFKLIEEKNNTVIYKTKNDILKVEIRRQFLDRKSVVQGKSVDLGGRRIIKKKNTQYTN